MIKPHSPNTAAFVTLLISPPPLAPYPSIFLPTPTATQGQGKFHSLCGQGPGSPVSAPWRLDSLSSCLKLPFPMSRDFCIAKPEGHCSPYLIRPLLYIPYSWNSLLLGLLIHLSLLIFSSAPLDALLTPFPPPQSHKYCSLGLLLLSFYKFFSDSLSWAQGFNDHGNANDASKSKNFDMNR